MVGFVIGLIDFDRRNVLLAVLPSALFHGGTNDTVALLPSTILHVSLGTIGGVTWFPCYNRRYGMGTMLPSALWHGNHVTIGGMTLWPCCHCCVYVIVALLPFAIIVCMALWTCYDGSLVSMGWM